jgi:hypothetical protein
MDNKCDICKGVEGQHKIKCPNHDATTCQACIDIAQWDADRRAGYLDDDGQD